MRLWLCIFFSFYILALPAQKPINQKAASSEPLSKYSVSSIKINSSFGEFCPSIHNNKFYFVSNRPNITGVEYASNDHTTTDIFVCDRKTPTLFSKPKILTEVNNKYDNGPAMVSSKGNTLLFSSSNKAGKLQIYFCVLENGKWSKPMLHPVSRSGSSYCHPVLSEDEKTLFFSSDKEGGYGGMDIYFSRLDGITWTNPRNLGAKVNSSGNEVFPYISNERKLYFSSKRTGGTGELDIYCFDLKDSIKGFAALLESPFNSPYDDFGLCFDSTTNQGYFSSNRYGKEGDNIFYFNKTVPDFDACSKQKVTNCYSFYKENYSLKDETKGSVYEWDLGDGNKVRAKGLNHCYSLPGFYTISLNIVDAVSGKVIYNEMTYTIAVRPNGLQIDVKDTLYINTPLEFDASSSELAGFKITNYAWKFSDTSYAKGPKTTFQYSKNGIYLVELSVDAKNLLTNQLKTFCIQKRILVGDKAYVEKNIRFFKYTELQPDADSLYYTDPEDRGLLLSAKKKSMFSPKELTTEAFNLNEDPLENVLLSEEQEFLRKHKFDLLTSDAASMGTLSEEDVALLEKIKKARKHNYNELNPDGSKMENISDEEILLREKNRLLRFKNAALPPIVDSIYMPKKEEQETVFRVDLGWSDSRLDKKSSIFEGIDKLEETKEDNRFRYTSGKEKDFESIVPYYENAKQKGFKDAAVIGFVNGSIGIGQAKNLKAILFDSASVENQALKVYFKYNAPLYDAKYNAQLDSLLKKFGHLEERKVLLIAHFDGLGSLDYNMNLNTQRTNNMINYLVKSGVKRQLIKTEFIIHPTENLAPDLLRRIEVFLQH